VACDYLERTYEKGASARYPLDPLTMNQQYPRGLRLPRKDV